jgi:uncharacterized protein YlzI (FlbEa/FlbD family)
MKFIKVHEWDDRGYYINAHQIQVIEPNYGNSTRISLIGDRHLLIKETFEQLMELIHG